MFPSSHPPSDPSTKDRRAASHLAVFAAWGLVAVFFGWKEYTRKHRLEDAIVDMTAHVDASTDAELLADLQIVLDAAGQPDWTMLSVLALVISLRSFYAAIGEVRLTRANAAIVSVLRKI